MGYVVSEEGHRPLREETKAVLQAPRPENVNDLRSFLGMINYLGHFLPDLATTLEPLHTLFRKNNRLSLLSSSLSSILHFCIWCVDTMETQNPP